MREALRTLAQCHSHRILHRDVKPGNFMLLSDADNAPLKAIGGSLLWALCAIVHPYRALQQRWQHLHEDQQGAAGPSCPLYPSSSRWHFRVSFS